MNNKLLLENAVIISPDIFIESGDILIEDGKILSVAASGSLNSPGDAQHVDLGGRIAMPGFVNPHAHLYSGLSAGLAAKGPTETFTDVLENFWWPLDSVHNEESVYYSAVAGVIDAVKHGVTCVFDHHASMNYVSGSLETVHRAFDLSGIKNVCCFEASDRISCESTAEHFEESVSFINKYRESGTTRGMLGMHANFTLSKKSMKIASDIIRNNAEDVPVHIHCGEGHEDLDYCIHEGFAGPVDRLHSFGLLSRQSILAHCIHLSEKDFNILREVQPFIVSNPESNANNCVGKPARERFPSYLIGTDGMSFDMLATLRAQYLMGSGLSENFSSLENAFIRNPEKLLSEFFPSCGRIESNYDADIAVLDYIPLTPITAENALGHLIFGAKGGNVYMTISSGRILYENGKLTFTFEEALRDEIKAAAASLHRRYYG
ncbi:MAG: amidohydrolase family protein [Spirochaetales bacterium]|uniref:Amidohydrolase family protein n=1 Tax=Candidatus Thalassospirochaeta sargassi TaxID=3119039 RepID=A0AAJ1IFV8_9SPIO|nr:amidohydrolase family protein [Spirochaetales bacterium]